LAGGGVDVTSRQGTITITNNAFLKNSTGLSDGGGGVQAWSDSGTITITNNTFSGNSGRWGGGVSAQVDSGTITITNNTFSGNSARRDYGADGGGVYVSSYYGPVTISNNTFSKNSGYFGGGVCARLYTDSPTLNIYNNIFFNNKGYSGDDLYVYCSHVANYIGATVNLYNNDFSGNADFDTGWSEDLYITLTGKYYHAGNIQEDPQFVDPENGDFHLKPSSPCIDNGTADAPGLPETDFEGDPRIVGGAPDIGADEYTEHPIPPPNQPPVVTSISQYQSDGTQIPEGGIVPETTIVFKATLEDPDGDDVRLEIELRKIDEPFTGEPTSETISDFVPSGSEVTITRFGLVDGDYHWQYRVKDSKGAVSEWKEFGEAGNVDFKVEPLRIISFTANPTTADTVPCEVSFTCKANSVISEYRWDFDGDGVIDEITNANQTTHTYTEAGSYKASVTLVGDTGSTASKTSVIRVGDLLAKYAPILRFTNLPEGVTDPDFSGKELYFPTKVEEMAGNAQLVCDGKDCHLDLEDSYLSTYRKNWTADSCTIYGREIHQGNRTYLQYWFFYLFNDWENDHEGDWEMITIELDENNEPERIGYSRHHSGEVREWSDPEIEIKDGTHPVIYVGLGSHASYHKRDATPLGTYLGEIEILGGIDYHLGGDQK